jgi:small subunit ribosomal protein S15
MPKKTTKEISDSAKTTKDEKLEEAAPVETKTEPKSAKKVSKKSETIKKFQRSAKDTGSTEVQIAILSEKIAQLSAHLSVHKKDNDSRMGLLKMISQRRSLLRYLEQPEQYKKLIASLGLRK